MEVTNCDLQIPQKWISKLIEFHAN